MPSRQATSRGVDLENLGFAAGSGWRRTPPARSRARSRRAPRVGPRFRAKPWSSPWLLLGAARRLRLCRPVRSGPLVRLAQRKRTNHRRAPPIEEIRSGPPPRPKPPETDGTVSPPMKPKLDRHARDFHRSMFIHFRSNVRFSARRASLARSRRTLGRPSRLSSPSDRPSRSKPFTRASSRENPYTHPPPSP